jgi:hypothetical protein
MDPEPGEDDNQGPAVSNFAEIGTADLEHDRKCFDLIPMFRLSYS